MSRSTSHGSSSARPSASAKNARGMAWRCWRRCRGRLRGAGSTSRGHRLSARRRPAASNGSPPGAARRRTSPAASGASCGPWWTCSAIDALIPNGCQGERQPGRLRSGRRRRGSRPPRRCRRSSRRSRIGAACRRRRGWRHAGSATVAAGNGPTGLSSSTVTVNVPVSAVPSAIDLVTNSTPVMWCSAPRSMVIKPSSPSPSVAHSVDGVAVDRQLGGEVGGELRRHVDDRGGTARGRPHGRRSRPATRADRCGTNRPATGRACRRRSCPARRRSTRRRVRGPAARRRAGDACAVHREAVVETAERLVLAPDDGADHRLGRGDAEDRPIGSLGSASKTRSLACTSANGSHLDGLVARARPRAVASPRRAERHGATAARVPPRPARVAV